MAADCVEFPDMPASREMKAQYAEQRQLLRAEQERRRQHFAEVRRIKDQQAELLAAQGQSRSPDRRQSRMRMRKRGARRVDEVPLLSSG